MTSLAPLMSSKSGEWGTPRPFFEALNARYEFTLDAAATPENALCPKYFTAQDNGLIMDWGVDRVWCNPPYGRGVGDWCRKAAECRTFVVLLLPARTDTAYWHDWVVDKASDIFFIRGRLYFTPSTAPAPFPSAVVVYDPTVCAATEMHSMTRHGELCGG